MRGDGAGQRRPEHRFDQCGLPFDITLDDGGVEGLDVVDVQHSVLVAFVGCHGYLYLSALESAAEKIEEWDCVSAEWDVLLATRSRAPRGCVEWAPFSSRSRSYSQGRLHPWLDGGSRRPPSSRGPRRLDQGPSADDPGGIGRTDLGLDRAAPFVSARCRVSSRRTVRRPESRRYAWRTGAGLCQGRGIGHRVWWACLSPRRGTRGRIPDFPVTRSHPPASWPSAANSSICRTYRKTAGEESRRRSPVANRWMRP